MKKSTFITRCANSRTGYDRERAAQLEAEFVALTNMSDQRDPSGGLRALYSKLSSMVQSARQCINDASRQGCFDADNIFRFARMSMMAQLEIVLLDELNEERKRQPGENEAELWDIFAADLEFMIDRLLENTKRADDPHRVFMTSLRIDVMERVAESIVTD